MHTYIHIYMYIRCTLFTLFRHLFLYELAYRRTQNAFSIISLFLTFLTFLPFFSSPHHNANNVQLQRSYYGFKVIHENSYSPLHTYSDTHTNTHSVWASDAYHYIHCYVITNWALVTLTDHTTKCNTLRRIAPSVCDLLSSSFDYSFLRNIWHLCPFAQQQMYSCTLVSEWKKIGSLKACVHF